MSESPRLLFFFFNDTATTEIYTLSLHDALPISDVAHLRVVPQLRHEQERRERERAERRDRALAPGGQRSEEHTSELQSLAYLVCRLLLEKKKKECSRSLAAATLQSRTDFALQRL